MKTGFDNRAFTATDDEATSETSETPAQIQVQARKTFRISYEYLLWCIFIILTLLCVVDRFVGTGDIVLNRSGIYHSTISLRI